MGSGPSFAIGPAGHALKGREVVEAGTGRHDHGQGRGGYAPLTSWRTGRHLCPVRGGRAAGRPGAACRRSTVPSESSSDEALGELIEPSSPRRWEVDVSPICSCGGGEVMVMRGSSPSGPEPGMPTRQPDPDDLVVFLNQLEVLGRQLYAAGYRRGTSDAQDGMLRASQAIAERRIPSLLPSSGEVVTPPPIPLGGRMSPPRTGLAGAPRSYAYGAVIALVRKSILENPEVGMRVNDMVTYCPPTGWMLLRMR